MSKLSPGTLILAIFAVLFGLVGAYAVKQYLHQEPEVAEVKPEHRQIVPMASVDLVPGRTLTLGDIILVRMTRDEIVKRGLPPGFMTNPSQIIGRTLREPLQRGDVFLTTMLYPEGLGPSVAERLEPGFRAITIPLENNPAELAMVSPGMIVDIVFRTATDELGHVPETTVTLLERVEVLAIGYETFQGTRTLHVGNSRDRGQTTVTLAVTPEQASALKVVEGHGTMSLAVRGPEDDQLVGRPAPQTLATLLDLPEPEPPFTTDIYRRGRLTTVTFEKGRPAVVAESFGGLPVATDATSATVRPVSQTLTKDSKDAKASCGCKAKDN